MDNDNSISNPQNDNDSLEQWETPVMLKLDLAQSETGAFMGALDADSGPLTS